MPTWDSLDAHVWDDLEGPLFSFEDYRIIEPQMEEEAEEAIIWDDPIDWDSIIPKAEPVDPQHWINGNPFKFEYIPPERRLGSEEMEGLMTLLLEDPRSEHTHDLDRFCFRSYVLQTIESTIVRLEEEMSVNPYRMKRDVVLEEFLGMIRNYILNFELVAPLPQYEVKCLLNYLLDHSGNYVEDWPLFKRYIVGLYYRDKIRNISYDCCIPYYAAQDFPYLALGLPCERLVPTSDFFYDFRYGKWIKKNYKEEDIVLFRKYEQFRPNRVFDLNNLNCLTVSVSNRNVKNIPRAERISQGWWMNNFEWIIPATFVCAGVSVYVWLHSSK